jgi:redox-sensitive bicupin YhaK (pirin superfamily)
MIKIDGRQNDLGGGMIVQRILPNRAKRMVGPFCFLDHMGPITTAPNQNTDVRPHPHIGLSTLTYLFDGRIVHRDSLGSVATIEPGEVNWMTAGGGISHSERAHKNELGVSRRLHGLQFWVALPDGKEEIAPSFTHYDKTKVPKHENDERKISLVAGEGFDLKSPVETSSPLVFAVVEAKKNFALNFSPSNFDLAVYVVKGAAQIGDDKIHQHQMLALEKDTLPNVQVQEGSQIVVIGGEPFSTPRHIWWNLVSSSKEKIEITKKQWQERSFPMVPGETEFIPLPEN